MGEKNLMLMDELAMAEREQREAFDEMHKAERRVRKANGWYAEILRLLEEDDKHG